MKILFLGLTPLIANGGAFDHIVIPGGQCNTPAAAAITVLNDRYCGTALNCLGAVPTATIATSTVCSNQKPFKISVESDGLEYMNPAVLGEGVTGNNVGFSISIKFHNHVCGSFSNFYFFVRLLHENNLSYKTGFIINKMSVV